MHQKFDEMFTDQAHTDANNILLYAIKCEKNVSLYFEHNWLKYSSFT